jgi:NAD-dependent dihydropyrimidine dehydrogenase PreA subunit
MKRQIITIDEQKCTGCGLCANGCPEGAIKIIKGKAKLVGDLLCDGLGACIGTCPEGAITIIEREAEPYAEKKVMSNIIKQGPEVLEAHLEHLKAHNQKEYLQEALDYMKDKGIKQVSPGGCPGSRMMDMRKKTAVSESAQGDIGSQLRQWPVQMHLISPVAPYFQGADVLLAADCVAYALGGFHADHLKGKCLAIACPKLDSGLDEYAAKIKSWIEDAKINTLTVMIMQVPCCNGLVQLVQRAMEGVKRKVPVKKIVVGIEGEILSEEWL